MPADEAIIAKLAAMHYAEEGYGLDVKFSMNNAVMATLGEFDGIIEIISEVFVWLGLGLAVFSSFLLMNFISTSISYKKREIGILRAVGARSSDVFKIFFSEAFIIALINFVLATAASLTTVILLNNYMRNSGINITLLNFGVLQAAMMLGISVAVAFLASFMPVYKIAHKKPVDAIKDR
jgi:ABC-type antimicrobial peptide transport system permease subunit